jgi:hypothetical protein
MAETSEETKARFAAEDKLFAELKASGDWPQKTCTVCAGLFMHPDTVCCCMRSHHFTGGLCLHCGFDERNG